MVFLFSPGNVIGCSVNAHRSGWAGSICADAASWNCAADQDFREGYCARGDSRCYHVHLFDHKAPRFIIDDNGAGWMLGVDAKALDDQILLIWGGEFAEPRGLREGRGGRGPVYGAYRIKACRRVPLGHRTGWEVVPHADGWARFHNLRIPRPHHRELGGKYLREVDRAVAVRVFEDAVVATNDRRDAGWFDPKDGDRLRSFAEHLGDWLKKAEVAADGRGYGRREQVIALRHTAGPTPSAPLAGLSAIAKVRVEPLAAAPKSVEVAAKASSTSVEESGQGLAGTVGSPMSLELPTLIETGAEARIVVAYGQDTLLALRIAALTKPLIVLRGDTGVGKSSLAMGLLNDPDMDRTISIPVSATWRGREDLLGYVNPITSEFEATPFTVFLHRAWQAWEKGDRRSRVVVFEEFNLSQPEHWLSDVLVVSQYSQHHDRVIHLGGKSLRGLDAKKAELNLSPAVRFIATMNTDHTTRTLSPRVLDRAAVVDLGLEPVKALQLVDVKLGDEMMLPINELHDLLQPKSATFSLRSAHSLAACLKKLDVLAIDAWGALDLVLVQDILSKVRLLARDPADENLAKELGKWSERHGRLRRCAQTIEHWAEALGSGMDVLHS